MNNAFGIWSDELACFVRLRDVAHRRFNDSPTLANAILSWGEKDAAQVARKAVASAIGCNVDLLHVLALKEADRPEPHTYI